MVKNMLNACHGDDAYDESRTVTELEEYCADYFGRPRALFMPSGVMSNQTAIRSLTQPGDEVICDASYHINFFESAQTADLSRVTLNALHTVDGVLTPELLDRTLASKARWNYTYAAPRLVWIENTISTHAGKIFPFDQLLQVGSWCKQQEVTLFMDGARLLNASVATGISPACYGAAVDALTVCFSKGLGAPFGSILIGDNDFITKARRNRKWLGGGLHQSGFMAAAALYALKNNVKRLELDHQNATLLGELLRREARLSVSAVQTNMVIFDVGGLNMTADEFVKRAAFEQVKLLVWRANEVRAVTSLNVNRSQAQQAGARLLKVATQASTVQELQSSIAAVR
jgi:threonine aldolase